MRYRLCLVGFLICWIGMIQAQLHDHPVIINTGLPSTYCTDIVMDDQGFLWVGTTAGLTRYDGTSFHHFNAIETGNTSLANRHILKLVFDSTRNGLWVGTISGLSFLDLQSLEFTNYHDRPDYGIDNIVIEAATLDQENHFWCSMNGIGIAEYLDEEDTFKIYPIQKNYGSKYDIDKIRSIMDLSPDPKNQDVFWLGTAGGLLKFDKQKSTFQLHYFSDIDIEKQLYLNQIRSVLPTEDQTLYLATWSKGISEYVPIASNDGMVVIPQNAFFNTGSSGVSPPLLSQPDGKIMVNMRSNCLFDRQTKIFSNCISFQNSADKTFGIQVQFQDDSDRYWATSEYGLFKFDPLDHQFEHHEIEAVEPFFYTGGQLLEMPGKDEIIFTYEHGEGVYRYDMTDHSIDLIRPTTNRYISENTFKGEGIIMQGNDEILILERKKIYSFTPSTSNLSPRNTALDDLNGLWYSATQDDAGIIWIGSFDSGLVKFNPERDEVESFTKDLLITGQEKPHSIHHVFADHDGNIWCAMSNGAFVFNKVQKNFIPIVIAGMEEFRIQNFIEADHGQIWCGVDNAGLGRIHTSALEKTDSIYVDLDQNLLRKDLTTVIQGLDKNIWMITNGGLQKYHPITGQSVLFQEKDGMKMYDARFNRNPSVLTKMIVLNTGQIAYAPRAGISLFTPSKMLENTEIPIPYLKEFRWGDSIVIHDLFENGTPLRIQYQKRNVEIELSAIGYSQSEFSAFYYKLEGIPRDWRKIDNRIVSFTALSPGDYTLLTKVINSSGKSSEIRRYSFSILKPWWQTWWFICLVAFVVFSLIWVLIKIRDRNRSRIMEKEKEIQVLLAGLESRALRNQMNPHFLFNIFNTIQELILTGDTERAYSYTSKFSKLLRMILEYAKKDDISIDQEVDFLTLYLELESLRFDEAFSFEIEIEEGLDFYHIPVFMVQPLVENSIHHGLLPKEGEKRIKIEFHEDNGSISCIVRDNGIGLQRDQSKTRQDRDHALKIIRKRLDIINSGSLKLQNNQDGNGVEAILQTPLKN